MISRKPHSLMKAFFSGLVLFRSTALNLLVRQDFMPPVRSFMSELFVVVVINFV